MTLSEYQDAAMRTAGRKPGQELTPETNLAVWALGLGGELGEVQSLIATAFETGEEVDRIGLKKELGDVLWYAAAITHALDAELTGLPDTDPIRLDEDFGVCALKIGGEVGLVLDLLKKQLGQGHPEKREELLTALSRVVQRVAVLGWRMQITLSDILETNVAKLKARYPEGFSNEASLNRSE